VFLEKLAQVHLVSRTLAVAPWILVAGTDFLERAGDFIALGVFDGCSENVAQFLQTQGLLRREQNGGFSRGPIL